MNAPDVKIEVCVETPAGARAAARAGADGIELCAALSEGGTTPSGGLLAAARRLGDLELVALIRPRRGDFLYDDDEFAVVLADVLVAKEAGADGVALGCLHVDGTVDVERLARLVDAARPMRVTFHRAFDMTPDAAVALDALIKVGVDRVLTSGQAPTASLGSAVLQTLVTRADGRIVVVAAGGIRSDNVVELVGRTGVRAVHFSARRDVDSPMRFRRPGVAMGAADVPDEYRRRVTDEAEVERCVTALRRQS